MTDNSRERFIARWAEEHGGPSPDERAIIDFIADEMAAAERRLYGDPETWRPLGFLGAVDPVVETEEQRVARELVPLVRAAAAETPIGEVPRLDEDFARLRFYTSRTLPDFNAATEQTHRELLDQHVRSLLFPWTTGCLTASDIRAAVDKAGQS